MNQTTNEVQLGNEFRQLGDYGEHLAAHALIKLGYDVAMVDHIGADLIATKGDSGTSYGISVKSRCFNSHTTEDRGYNFKFSDKFKLECFCNRFNLKPLLAFVVVDERDCFESVFIIDTDSMNESNNGYPFSAQTFRKRQHGFYFSFGPVQNKHTRKTRFEDLKDKSLHFIMLKQTEIK